MPLFVRCTAFTDLVRRVVALEGEIGGSYTAGTGLNLTGTEFSITDPTARKDLTLAQFAATTSAQLAGIISNETGSGFLVFGTNPNLDGPRVINGIQGATGIKILDFATVGGAVNGLLATASSTGNAVTLSAQGTDGSISINLVPIGTGTVQYNGIEIGFRGVPSIAHVAAEVTTLDSSGKSYDHPASDANDRTVTIDGAVNYPVGTCISGTNMSANVQSVAITTDTLYLAGTGATGTRAVAQYGVWTARKQAAGVWIISGINVT